MTEREDHPTESRRVTAPGRRSFLLGSAGVAGAGALALGAATPAAADTGPDYSSPSVLGTPARSRAQAPKRRQTRIGIGYETWFDAVGWPRPEAEPILGHYSSLDERVIGQHASWLTHAGFDHILIDWSNNLGGNWTNGTAEKIIAGTEKLLEVYAKRPERSRPQVTLLIGQDGGQVGTANFNLQIDRIKGYLANPAYRPMFVDHDGKPLLSIFTGARTTLPPTWTDPAFTVRWTGAFREIVLNPGGVWSWVDRLPYANGAETPLSSFATTGLNGWTAQGPWKVADFTAHPAFNKEVALTIATSQPAPGSSQQTGTLTSPAFTISEKIISFNAVGFDMRSGSDLQSLAGRNVFLLKDAASGEILRHTTPPGDPSRLYVRQFNVADLIGRKVVFQAVNNATDGGGIGWMGFDGLIQQRAEQMTAVVSNGGNEAPGAYLNWDTHNRNSGAYLVEMMSNAFRVEPEFLLVQQWNEFGRPDQYSVPGSNDIEPTRIKHLAGADSDGWGFYYLKLVRDLIDQYRSGRPYPSVQLDSRFP